MVRNGFITSGKSKINWCTNTCLLWAERFTPYLFKVPCRISYLLHTLIQLFLSSVWLILCQPIPGQDAFASLAFACRLCVTWSEKSGMPDLVRWVVRFGKLEHIIVLF